ncbi:MULTISPECIES: hypothetical protein [Rhizobium/Agrobacterium group]|uniref:Uncharacterized protein n=2 Tax=Neorhizobium TaxID=1525371 RepID=A0ABY8M6F6_9HYPH|nr:MULTISPECIES: hypothetical protein [Rhizobium/Agrobacterium group]WGI69992.1 hypothetical protein QEO92_08090 [Neorhizobium petrolearium]WGI70019.1 hypothetical protein QEO92_08250 [Neorhizobium petrolearium]WGI70741.1 hypothetical protein QEO92_12195 [Neorhizobium petrolearium]
MRQVYGMKVTRLTLGDLSICPWKQVGYRRREASGWGGRGQQKP